MPHSNAATALRVKPFAKSFAWTSRLALLAFLPFGFAQGIAQNSRPAKENASTAQEKVLPADELESRVGAAQKARNSGDPAAVAMANRAVIATALRELGGLRLVHSDFAGSVKLYNDSLRYENSLDAIIAIGLAELQAGHTEQAIDYGTRAHTADPRNLAADRLLASALDQNGKYAAAVVPFTKEEEDESATSIQDANHSAARRKFTPVQLAAAEAREKAVQAALALAYNDLATAQAIEKKYTEAIDDYHQAEHWDSSLAGLEKNLGLCAFRMKDYAEAARALAQAVAQGDSSVGVRAMLGLAYFGLDNYAGAERSFEPLGSAGMKDAEVGYAWAASLAHIGDMKNAGEVLSAFESEARPNDVLLLVGQLWTEIGDFTRAEATLDRALAADPSLPKAHFYKGLACIRSEHWQEAEEEFQAEVHLNPNYLDAVYHLGFVEQEQSRTGEALVLYLKVIAANPQYADAQYEAGKIYFDRGQYPDAAQRLEAAARLAPEKDYVHYQLQSVYRKLGRSADADRELEVYKQMKAQSRQRIADAMKHTP
jgi:tetratricopeptide (TPR) repeat protein